MTWPARPSPPLAHQIARLRLGSARRPGQRQRRGGGAARRGAVGLPVTAGAGTDLPGRVVHVRPLALEFPEVLVQGLEEDAAIGRHHEMGRAVLLDGHDSPLHARPEGGLPTGTAQRRLPAPAGGPVTRQRLIDPQPFDLARLDSLHALVDIGHDAEGLVAGGVLRIAGRLHLRRDTAGRPAAAGCQQESLASA